MRSFLVVFVILLATCVCASPLTIPLKKLWRSGAYLEGSPAADRARATLLRGRASGGLTTAPATNLAYIQYTTRVGIGNPATYYNLIVDTGSSNTFCGTGIRYVKTSSSIPTGQNVSVAYGSGYFVGVEYLDRVTLAPHFVITNQSIGDALSDANFKGVDGIIGVGPLDLTQGTLSPDVNATIPTIMNNLLSQGLIEDQLLGVYFSPSTKHSDTNGALTYGGADRSLFKGELMYTSRTKTLPAAYYWGINITSSTYGNHTVIPVSTAGVVDTGTTLVLLADDFFAVYMDAIPGATLDPQTGLIDIPPSSVQHMQPLICSIGGHQFIIDVSAQLIPQDQNTAWGGAAGKWYGVVSNLGSPSGGGLDFILGQKFMERYYAVFDADANRVGFAQTNHTFTTDGKV